LVKRGISAATVSSTSFVPVSRTVARALGVPELPVIEVDEQVGHVAPADLQEIARQIADVVPDILRKYQSQNVKGQQREHPESFDALNVEAGTDLTDRVNEIFLQENMTDGLPVVVPTEDRVQAMLKTVSASPDEVLGVFKPRGGVATVIKVAVCAVMAGCRPKHFPIVVAAIRAIATPGFEMHSCQTAAHPHSPLIIVNGPAAVEAGMSNGHDLTPTAWQANLVICRAVRLVTINMVGLKNVIASHTPGYLGRITDCIRENEEESPWATYHTDLGYRRDDSTVTVFAAEPPHVVDERGSTTAQSMLTTFARVIANGGNRSVFRDGWQLVLMAPEHAKYVASQGFSKEDVREFLYHVARVPLHEFPQNNLDSFSAWRKQMFTNVSEHVGVPVCRNKEDIKIFVHGGIGPHSLYVPGLGNAVVTVPIERKG
jgi:hypothetical protein